MHYSSLRKTVVSHLNEHNAARHYYANKSTFVETGRKSEAYSVSHDENATMIQLSGELHV